MCLQFIFFVIQISMTLKEYIRKNGYNYKSFAREFGTHYRNVESWAKGDRLPRWKDAERIFIFTDNQVTGSDLYAEQISRQKTILQRKNPNS